jgi:hypothetical protein
LIWREIFTTALNSANRKIESSVFFDPAIIHRSLPSIDWNTSAAFGAAYILMILASVDKEWSDIRAIDLNLG